MELLCLHTSLDNQIIIIITLIRCILFFTWDVHYVVCHVWKFEFALYAHRAREKKPIYVPERIRAAGFTDLR